VYFATSIAALLFEIVAVGFCGSKGSIGIPAAFAPGASATDTESLT
jgi:hypothetical protein